MNFDWFGRGKAVTSASAALHMSQQPIFIQITSRLLLAIMIGSLFSLLIVPWQQASNGYGQLIAYDPVEREQAIEAPVKGRVVRWHVKEGDKVEIGQPLAVIEAMKMENILRAGKAGTVKSVSAAQGESLPVDAVILELA